MVIMCVRGGIAMVDVHDGPCLCVNPERTGFYGTATNENFVKSVAQYGMPLADSLHCQECRLRLSEEDPRTRLGTIHG